MPERCVYGVGWKAHPHTKEVYIYGSVGAQNIINELCIVHTHYALGGGSLMHRFGGEMSAWIMHSP